MRFYLDTSVFGGYYDKEFDADTLISWNFRHMVNFFQIRRYNGINLMHGYSELDIRSPREVLS